MKTLKIIGKLIVVAIISIGIVSALYGNNIVAFYKAARKAQVHQKHLQPELGQYCSVESTEVIGESTFVIGYSFKGTLK